MGKMGSNRIQTSGDQRLGGNGADMANSFGMAQSNPQLSGLTKFTKFQQELCNAKQNAGFGYSRSYGVSQLMSMYAPPPPPWIPTINKLSTRYNYEHDKWKYDIFSRECRTKHQQLMEAISIGANKLDASANNQRNQTWWGKAASRFW